MRFVARFHLLYVGIVHKRVFSTEEFNWMELDANAGMVSGQALPASRGKQGVVPAILDCGRALFSSEYISVEWYQFLLFFYRGW